MLGLIDLVQQRWCTTSDVEGNLNEKEFIDFSVSHPNVIWLQTTDDDFPFSYKQGNILPFSKWCPFSVNAQLSSDDWLNVLKQLEQIGKNANAFSKEYHSKLFSHFTLPKEMMFPAKLQSACTCVDKLFAAKAVEKKSQRKKNAVLEFKSFFPIVNFVSWLLSMQGSIPLWITDDIQPIERKMLLKDILALPKQLLMLDTVVSLRVVDFPQNSLPESVQKLSIARYGIESLPIDVFRRLFDETLLSEKHSELLNKEYTVYVYPMSEKKSLFDFVFPLDREFQLSSLLNKNLWLSSMIYLAHFYMKWQKQGQATGKTGAFSLFNVILLCFHLEKIKQGEFINFEELQVIFELKT